MALASAQNSRTRRRRGNHRTALIRPPTCGRLEERVSLSLRERAGVRGNQASKLISVPASRRPMEVHRIAILSPTEVSSRYVCKTKAWPFADHRVLHLGSAK